MAAVIAILAGAVVVAASSDPAPAPQGPPAEGPPQGPEGRSAAAPEHRSVRSPVRRTPPGPDRAGGRIAADGRAGRVAFAVVGPDGELHGRNEHEPFQSASVVKALILAAELQRIDDAGGRLDPAIAAELRRMITVSDNDAATSVFDRVGPEGVDAIAHRAGMRDLRSSTTWGATAISAADMAVMFADLGRVFPERFEQFGLGLLGSIVPEQSLGDPEGRRRERGWSVRFKGGWRPDPGGQIVNQAAELRRGGVERLDRRPQRPPALDGLRDRDGRGDRRAAPAGRIEGRRR